MSTPPNNSLHATIASSAAAALSSSSSATMAGLSLGSAPPPTAAGANCKSRFPRLQECAHFHYEVSTVDLPKNFKVIMLGIDNSSTTTTLSPSESGGATNDTHAKPNVNSTSTSSNLPTSLSSSSTSSSSSSSNNGESYLFHVQVTANEKRWIIYRSYENFRYLDKYLHDCIFDRKFSALDELVSLSWPPGSTLNDSGGAGAGGTISKASKKPATTTTSPATSDFLKQLRLTLAAYLTRFSEIAFVNPINCGPILNWFEVSKLFTNHSVQLFRRKFKT